MTLYGIKNCNTVKAAVDWLNKNHVAFDFHDYKKVGITEEKLRDWCKQVGWGKLLNTRGTTWRQLDEKTQQKITSEKAAIALMMEKTSIIKRPLIEKNDRVVLLGFDEVQYKEALK